MKIFVGRESNLGNFTYKAIKADNQSVSFHLENLFGRHIRTIMKVVQQNMTQEKDLPLNDGRRIAIINFDEIN